MTQTQKSMLDKALTRAIAQDITIIGQGTLKATGARVWFVTSGTDEGSCYMVVQVSHDDLTCTCKAGQKGQYCKHRSVVTARLMYERKLQAMLGGDNDAARDASLIQRHDGGPRLYR